MRKFKKIFVILIAVVLSVAICMVSISAFNVVEVFEYDNELYAVETISVNEDNNILSVAIDLSCEDTVELSRVYAELDVTVLYYGNPPSSPITSYRETDGRMVYPNETEDSDEVLVTITNYDRGYPNIVITVIVTYTLYFTDNSNEIYSYEYTCLPNEDQYSRW